MAARKANQENTPWAKISATGQGHDGSVLTGLSQKSERKEPGHKVAFKVAFDGAVNQPVADCQ